MTPQRIHVVISIAALAALCQFLSSCAPYYSTQVSFPATMAQTEEVAAATAHNLAEISVIQDAATITDSATFEMRYVGTRAYATLNSGVRSTPKFGVRMHATGEATTVTVNSVGNDRLSSIFVVAMEQELANRGILQRDTMHLPYVGMSQKSSTLHQFLNLVNPGLGLWYVMDDNPYYTAHSWWEPYLLGGVDLGALALAVPAVKHTLANKAERAEQYRAVIGVGIASALRYIFGINGLMDIHEYNDLTETPYYLSASYVNKRITSIGISLRLP
ncbi:MAG TPA: hypothetical protein VFJ29_04485 [Candidatus Kapabacteria bacterium]|nr:hypothetical protein [Candidatus Kapabacteria bacterium]